jgi:hypothetical protein
MTLQPVVTVPPKRRLDARAVAVALFFGAVTVWTIAGPCGLLQALHEQAEASGGSGWLQLGAFVVQSPCALAFAVGSVFVLPPPAGKRFLRWGLIAWAAVAALQIYMWSVITSLPGGGC